MALATLGFRIDIGCKYKQKFNNANHFSRFFSVRGKKSVILTQKEWKVFSVEWKV